MTHSALLQADWSAVLASLPPSLDLDASARRTGAFQRPRQIRSPRDLLRLALAYGACDLSLRQTCAWAEAQGIAALADPSLLERLVKAAPWLAHILARLIALPKPRAGRWRARRLRVVDATTVCRPGADQTTWRLHVGYDLASGQIDHLALTDGHGAESLRRLPVATGDLVLGDAGYARARDLHSVREAGADLLVRAGWASLRLCDEAGGRLDLFGLLADLALAPGAVGERAVGVAARGAGAPLRLRLVVRRKTRRQAALARARVRQRAAKAGKRADRRSLRAASYVLLLTSLPAREVSGEEVAQLYRLRWQIELSFKRLKSVAGLDRLPARTPEVGQAWLYARLIAAVLAERQAGLVEARSREAQHSGGEVPADAAAFSPWAVCGAAPASAGVALGAGEAGAGELAWGGVRSAVLGGAA
jgi:hypothetical protein